MAKVRFTAGRIASFCCDAGKTQSFLWDSDVPGLGLRVTAAGAKSYVFQAKHQGKSLRLTIGDPAIWPLDLPKSASPDQKSARSEARRLKTLLDEGRDPRLVAADKLAAEHTAREARAVAAAARERQIERETVTLGMAWPLYIEARRNAGHEPWSAWHVRDHENVARRGGEPKKRGKGFTEPGPLASLLDVRLVELNEQRIAEWLTTETPTRPTQAALAFRLLSVFLNWCASQPDYAGLVPAGACKARHVRDKVPRKQTKQEDCLQREQLAAWFRAVRKMDKPVHAAYLQCLLLTGARRRELAALKWDDIDFQWKTLTIRDKVEGVRIIPLTPYVEHLLRSLKQKNDTPPSKRRLRTLKERDEEWEPSEWVFSSVSSATGQLVDPTPGHKRALIAAGLPDLTLHGLRRSFGTLAEWTETPTGVVAQIMGHAPSALAEKHYRRRPVDLLRMWHVKIETWMLEQAGITFEPAEPSLRVVVSGSKA